MLASHKKSKALASLAVQNRESSRQLLFDQELRLCGRRIGKGNEPHLVRQASQGTEELAFTGIHVISPRMLDMITEDGVFSIIEGYLRLAGAGETIVGFRADQYYWRDLGKSEHIKQAEKDMSDKRSSALRQSYL